MRASTPVEMRLGRPLHMLDEVESTNDFVRRLALNGEPEGVTVVARSQTAGRGRRGRVWVSTPGKGVYLSMLLRPDLPALNVGALSMLGGVAVADMLERLGIDGVRIKWPNDVLANGRKIAGILIEPRLDGRRVEFAVCGIGVNVAQTSDDFPPDLRERATSCLREGVSADCAYVVKCLIDRVGFWYDALNRGEVEVLRQAWVSRGGRDAAPEVD